MSANLGSLESQPLYSRSRGDSRPVFTLERASDARLPAALDRLSVPAAAFLDPTPLQRAAQMGWQVSTAAVDMTFGTHWAIGQHLQSSSKLRRIHRDNRQIAQLLIGDSRLAQASTSTQRRVHKNAHAVLALNRHGHHAAHVRKYLYGDSVMVGGLPFGAGLTIGPQIGGGFSAALTAAAVPLLWIGAPVLSAAAVGVAIHEGMRYRRAGRLGRNVGAIGFRMVMGNERAVQALLAARIRSKRVHASTKSVSLIGCAISAPLLVVGIIPGVAVVAPAATALTWAWYYHHNHLRYRPSLSASQRVMLGGKRDIINRIDLAHKARMSLKAVKEQKRLIYPRGGQAILGLRETAKSLAWIRRWWSGVPKAYPTPHETVFKFLQALANHEVEFVRYQEALQRHALAKLYRSGRDAQDTAKRQGELANQNGALASWLADRTSESRVLNRYDKTPDAGAVVQHFLVFLQRYHLLDNFTRNAILRNATVKHRFLDQGAMTQDKTSFHFDVAHLARLIDADMPDTSKSGQRLAREMCEIAERYLLKEEKKRLTFFERELLDVLAYRLDGHNHADYPRHTG
jgi:hypothetical protein